MVSTEYFPAPTLLCEGPPSIPLRSVRAKGRTNGQGVGLSPTTTCPFATDPSTGTTPRSTARTPVSVRRSLATTSLTDRADPPRVDEPVEEGLEGFGVRVGSPHPRCRDPAPLRLDGLGSKGPEVPRPEPVAPKRKVEVG